MGVGDCGLMKRSNNERMIGCQSHNISMSQEEVSSGE